MTFDHFYFQVGQPFFYNFNFARPAKTGTEATPKIALSFAKLKCASGSIRPDESVCERHGHIRERHSTTYHKCILYIIVKSEPRNSRALRSNICYSFSRESNSKVKCIGCVAGKRNLKSECIAHMGYTIFKN